MELGSSIQEFQEKNLDYPQFSRIALETLLTAISVYLLLHPPLSFEEDDLLRSHVEDLVEGWQISHELTDIE